MNFSGGIVNKIIRLRTSAQNGAPICLYLLFFTKAPGSKHLNKEEGRDDPTSALPPGGKQASWQPSSTANKENALKLFKNATVFSQNCHYSEN